MKAIETTLDPQSFVAAGTAFKRAVPGGWYLATILFPSARRQAVWAAGAFCNMICDAMLAPAEQVECSGEPIDPRVAMLQRRLDDLYDGQLDLPPLDRRSETDHILHAASIIVRRHRVPRQHFIELAEGTIADQKVHRYPTWASLRKQCDLTGGAIANIMASIVGVTHSDAHADARTMGCAIRFTGILRNLAAQRQVDRVYLPLEDLAKFRYSERDFSAGTVNPSFYELLQFQIGRARDMFREAARGICWVAGDGAKLAVSVLVAQNLGVLRAISRYQGEILLRRPESSIPEKLGLALDVWRLARRQADEPLPHLFES